MKRLLFILSALCALSVQAQTKLSFFGQKSTDKVSATPYGANDAAGHYVQADDARLYYEVYGTGEPLLVLHGGIVGTTYELGQLIDSLSTRYQVIAMTTRGHGRSEIGHSPITYKQRATDALTVLKAVTDKPVIVLGFSDGAYTGYKFASMFPGRVKKLVAIGAGENQQLMRKVVVNKVEDMLKTAPEFMKSQMALMPEPERLQEHWNMLPVFYNDDMIVSKKLLSSIQCPVLLMAGELDPNAPLDTNISAYKMIPDCELAIIANGTHQVFIDNFPAVWANIVPFLNK